MKFRPQQHIEESPTDYLIPLMDVLFILITFFVITFSMSRIETELNISVPASESSDNALKDVGQVVINVRADGTIVVNQLEQTLPQLESRLKAISLVNLKQAVVVRGDKTATYEDIFNVLDACRKVGLYHVSFASQSPTKTAPP